MDTVISVGRRVAVDVVGAELVEGVEGADGDVLVVLGPGGGVSQDKVAVLRKVLELDTVGSWRKFHNYGVLEGFRLF